MTMAKLSRHAQQRRKQMGVTEHRIDAVLQDPELVYPSDPTEHPESRMLYQRGDLVVVVDVATGDVITLLWHLKEGR